MRKEDESMISWERDAIHMVAYESGCIADNSESIVDWKSL